MSVYHIIPGKGKPDPSEKLMPLYTTGYPRSGNTWLGRLLSDLLRSPLQTHVGAGMEWFGKYHDGGHVIRKKHIPSYGDEYPDMISDGRVVFIQRDPRDIAVSAMYYNSMLATEDNLMHVISTMVNLKARTDIKFYHNVGEYEAWIRSYADNHSAATANTKYELLHKYPVLELQRILRHLAGIEVDDEWVTECYERQRFDNWKDRYDHSMRKGIVGDWKNHFTRKPAKFIADHLNKLMMEQGYIKDYNWWIERPE